MNLRDAGRAGRVQTETMLQWIQRHRWVITAGKAVAAVASAGAALVSVWTFARAWGIFGDSGPTRLTISDIGVAWVGITPAADTLTALGDTLHLAAVVTDKRGTSLVGATLRWTSDEPRIATVNNSGTVIAQRPGAVTIVATVGEVMARAHIVVRQRVGAVRIAGDSAVTLAEDARRVLAVRALDDNGHPVPVRGITWKTADSSVAWVDSGGRAVGQNAGRTTLTATVDGVNGDVPVTVAPVAGHLTLLAGDGQRGPAGDPLSQPVVARVLSRRGHPVEGVAVRFRSDDGDGGGDPSTVFSDDAGRVRSTWRLGALPGAQRLLVTADGVDSALAVDAEADPVAANTRVSMLGAGQQSAARMALPGPVGIRVTDSAGRPEPGVPVRWTALDDGAVAATSPRTDSLGESHAAWTLGPRAGPQRVRVEIGAGHAVPPAIVRATATAGPPARLTLESGDGQHGVAGTALAKRIIVRVFDAGGNPAPGAALTVAPGAGSVAESTVVADEQGRVHFTWTLGRAAGTQRLTVRAPDGKPEASTTAHAGPGRPANLAIADLPDESRAGHPLDHPVTATLTDLYGNPVPDAAVTITPSAGRVSPARAATDAHGEVRTRWTLGSRTGTQSLRFSVRSTDVTAAADLRAVDAPPPPPEKKPPAKKTSGRKPSGRP